ncbi:hypothetical protein [uncultured Treponema sp.]|nr:hypothetical protein [uncultured Treponema sp.]
MTGDGQEADSKGDLWFRSDIYTQVCCEFSDSPYTCGEGNGFRLVHSSIK